MMQCGENNRDVDVDAIEPWRDCATRLAVSPAGGCGGGGSSRCGGLWWWWVVVVTVKPNNAEREP